MNEWKEYKLGDLCEITSSKRVFYSEYVPFGVPFFRSKEIIDLHNNRNIATELFISEDRYNEIRVKFGVPQTDDILLTSVGSLGIPYKVKNGDRFYFKDGNLTWFRNINKNGISPDYLMHWLCSSIGKQKLDEVTIGSTQPALTISGLKSIDILLPPLAEQERIAGILSSLDDKIDLLTRQNSTLESMAETLFRQYFIETTDTQSGKLGDYITETTGGDWGKENCEDEFSKAVQCIRGTDIADLNSGIATKTPIRFIKEVKFEKIEPRNGDLILEISGGTETQSTGRVTYINDDIKSLFDYPLVFSNFCRMLRMKDARYSYFTYCYINYLYQQDEFFNLENGSSGIKNLDYKALLFDLEYPMPKNEQAIDDFDVLVKPVFKKINKNKQQVRSLIKLRDSLLPKLMNREIIING